MQLRLRPEHRRGIDPYMEIPVLENDASLQVAITHVIRLLLSREIDQRTAALVLYGLQTSAAIARRGPIEPDPADVVSDCMQVYKEDLTDKQDSTAPAKPGSVQQPAAQTSGKSEENASANAAPQPPKRPPIDAGPRVPDRDFGRRLGRALERNQEEAAAAAQAKLRNPT